MGQDVGSDGSLKEGCSARWARGRRPEPGSWRVKGRAGAGRALRFCEDLAVPERRAGSPGSELLRNKGRQSGHQGLPRVGYSYPVPNTSHRAILGAVNLPTCAGWVVSSLAAPTGADHRLVHRVPGAHLRLLPGLSGREGRQLRLLLLRRLALVGDGA